MSNSNPLVSVGIPTYNRAAGLRQTLECITTQTYQNLQIIVSDNCSPDPEVALVLKEYADKDSRVIPFIQSENRGPGENFEFVFKQSSGDYYMWAADDDYWAAEFIEEMVALLQSNEQASVAFCSLIVKSTGEIFDYNTDHADLSSPNLDKRLKNFLLWKEGRLGKGSIVYGLHRRDKLAISQASIFDYSNDIKNFSPDILQTYYFLLSGPVIFSSKPLFTLTLPGTGFVSYTSFVYNKNDFTKNLAKLWRREKFYFTVSKTIWNSEASFACFLYSLFTIFTRHLYAFVASIKRAFGLKTL